MRTKAAAPAFSLRHPAWRVLLGLILMQAGFTGVTVNCMGVLITAVIADVGYSASSLAFFYTLRGLVSAALVAPMLSLFLRRKNNLLIVALGLMGGASIAAASRFTALWQWYAAAVLSGASYSLNAVLVPNIVNNWFMGNRGLANGIALSASGIAGAIFSPVMAGLILRFGWRTTAVVQGLSIFLLTAVPALFLVRYSPADCGVEPFGAAEGGPTQTARRTDAEDRRVDTRAFLLVMVICVLAYLGTTYNNQLPLVARSYGFSAMTGAAMTSIAMVGNIGGKFLFGAVCDRIGVHRAGVGALIIVGIGFVLISSGAGSSWALYAGALCFGLVYASATVLVPLLCISSFGERQYARPMSRIIAAAQLGSSAGSPSIAAVYDHTGSFRPALLAGCLGCAVSIACLLSLLRRGRTGKSLP